ncbi:hypothetical protein MAR_013816, partial [Mya arenaria]
VCPGKTGEVSVLKVSVWGRQGRSLCSRCVSGEDRGGQCAQGECLGKTGEVTVLKVCVRGRRGRSVYGEVRVEITVLYLSVGEDKGGYCALCEAQAMTTSKWDLLGEDENKQGNEEDIDG